MLLKIRELIVRFGGLIAVDHMELDVEDGQVVGLVGPNGAGKSTVLNAINGLVPFSGQLSFHHDGKLVDLGKIAPFHRPHVGIGRTFQHPQLAPELTVEDNVSLGLFASSTVSWLAAGLRLPRAVASEARGKDAVVASATMLGIGQWLGNVPGELPYGIQKIVELARAMVSGPRLLLLDEPSAGLNAEEKGVVRQLLTELQTTQGVAMLVVDHDMEFIFALCQRIYAMNFGKPLAAGSPATIRNDAMVRAAYLGQDGEGV